MNTYATGAALRRRDEILRLVREQAVRSQEELAHLLAGKGFHVTQPTLSRDIKDLGLVKTAGGYALTGEKSPPVKGLSTTRWEEHFTRVFRESVLSVREAATLIVIKTPPAQAQLVAHVLDECPSPEWAGTIAGDDTVFVATTSAASAMNVAQRFSALITEQARSLRARRRS